MLGNVQLLFGAISLALVVSILFVTGNTMAMTVRDRTGEIAVLRALGFRRTLVGALVAIEATVVGAAGASLGALGAWFLITIGQGAWGEVFPIFAELGVGPRTTAWVVICGAVLGGLASLPPALAATRIDAAQALRKVA